MSEDNDLECAVSLRVRAVFAAIRSQRGITDDQLTNAILTWFSELDPVEQQRVLDEAGRDGGAELLPMRLVRRGEGEANLF